MFRACHRRSDSIPADFANLVSNAVKFTASGSVQLRLGMREGAAHLRLEVADTGPGIAPDKLGAIFEEFTQADGSISRKYGGTGLGLAITRRLVKMLGGEITVRTQVGSGRYVRSNYR